MNRRKVLFLIESLSGGGAEKVLTTLVQHIDKERFDVTVCAISGGGKYEDAIKKQVDYRAILNNPKEGNAWKKWLYVLKHHLVYQWLPLSMAYRWFVPQGNDVEVAYVEGFTTKLLSHSINKKARKYAWVHTDLENNHWTTSVYASFDEEVNAYNKYDKVFCVSNTAVKGFEKTIMGVRVKRGTLYNPINSQEIRNMASEGTRVEHVRPLLVTVGRLEHQKGYDRLVRIAKHLVDDGLKFELWILGVGSQEADLKQYIQENHLEECVKLLGFHTNPYKYIVQGDLFVCSSRSEGYSTAVTEALILGLPVITTDCSGMAELLKDGECGIITENDEGAFYEGVKRLLKDAALLEYYREKAVERGNDFTIESLMKPIENILLG
ncbi:MAG: glycosyltransferase [Bacteroidaceae bacterium]|nr:glycosyltransferase [Bacteroidaceae bacterium]